MGRLTSTDRDVYCNNIVVYKGHLSTDCDVVVGSGARTGRTRAFRDAHLADHAW